MLNFIILMAAILVASSENIWVLCLGTIGVGFAALISFLLNYPTGQR